MGNKVTAFVFATSDRVFRLSISEIFKVQIKYVFNSIFSSEEAGICITAATVRGILDWVFTQTLSRVLKAGKMATKYILSDK